MDFVIVLMIESSIISGGSTQLSLAPNLIEKIDVLTGSANTWPTKSGQTNLFQLMELSQISPVILHYHRQLTVTESVSPGDRASSRVSTTIKTLRPLVKAGAGGKGAEVCGFRVRF